MAASVSPSITIASPAATVVVVVAVGAVLAQSVNRLCRRRRSSRVSAMSLKDIPARDEKDDGVPQALQGENRCRGHVKLIGRLAGNPAVDAVHAARDPGDEDAYGKKKAGSQVCPLDRVGHGKLSADALD